MCGGGGVERCVTSAYHPQTGGLCERANKTGRSWIAKYVGQGVEWDEYPKTSGGIVPRMIVFHLFVCLFVCLWD